MRACTGYWLAVMLRSQRYFPPLLFFVLGVVVLTANDNGPLVSCYGACAAVLFLSALWLMIALIGTEEPAHRAVMTVNAGSSARVIGGAVLAVVAAGIVAMAFGVLFPDVSGDHVVTSPAVLAGVALQFCALLCGIAAGLLCSRLTIASTAVSLVLALVVAIAVYLVPWVSPLHTALVVSDRHVPPARLLGELGTLTATAIGLVVVAAFAAGFVSLRRD